jgi:type IV secretory pathway VirB10-like protein
LGPILMPAPLQKAGQGMPLREAAHAGQMALTHDRRLIADVYVAASTASSAVPILPAAEVPPQSTTEASTVVAPGLAAGALVSAAIGASRPILPATAETGSLSAPMTAPVTARLLGRQSLILPKGTSIDCTLETAIDSTLPGLTRCLTATDTFSADGHVVLLERGTELVGETQGQVQQGASRVFVLWSEARTPHGVIVPLESPGADELGRSGLPGTVQRHFWERFGAAILVSTIDGAVQAAVQSSSHGEGTVIYNPGASQDVMTEVLRSTVAIPPTVRKANGDRIQVLAARDVDFGDVYELRTTAAGR